jgi:hypothetical protein
MIAPVGDIVERPGIRRLVGVEHLQMRADGAGIGERLADGKTISDCGLIQGINF